MSRHVVVGWTTPEKLPPELQGGYRRQCAEARAAGITPRVVVCALRELVVVISADEAAAVEVYEDLLVLAREAGCHVGDVQS